MTEQNYCGRDKHTGRLKHSCAACLQAWYTPVTLSSDRQRNFYHLCG